MEETIDSLNRLEESLKQSTDTATNQISLDDLHRARGLLQSRCDQLTMR